MLVFYGFDDMRLGDKLKQWIVAHIRNEDVNTKYEISAMDCKTKIGWDVTLKFYKNTIRFYVAETWIDGEYMCAEERTINLDTNLYKEVS